jgi:cytochrome b561
LAFTIFNEGSRVSSKSLTQGSLTLAAPLRSGRYAVPAQALHWITAVLMLALLPLAWVMVNMPRTEANRELIYTLHKSLGLTVLALVAARLILRAIHPAPQLPGSLARWERKSAALSHWLLYLIMVGMPISGYLFSAWGGHAVTYFGLFTLPGLAKSDALQQVAFWAHVAIGQWLTYALIVLHIVATGWHTAVRRDGMLFRMLPEQRTATGIAASGKSVLAGEQLGKRE